MNVHTQYYKKLDKKTRVRPFCCFFSGNMKRRLKQYKKQVLFAKEKKLV